MVDESHTKRTFQGAVKMPSSLLPTSKTTRKPPRWRLISNDQIETFCEKKNTVTSLADLNETTTTDGFQFKKSSNHAMFYKLVFDEEAKLPKFLESIKVDSDCFFSCIAMTY